MAIKVLLRRYSNLAGFSTLNPKTQVTVADSTSSGVAFKEVLENKIILSQVNLSLTGGVTEFSHCKISVAFPLITAENLIRSWVASTSTIDHDPDDVWVENLSAYASHIVPGFGFDIVVRAPNNSWGIYNVYTEIS